MSAHYDNLLRQRGLREAFDIAADDAEKLRKYIAGLPYTVSARHADLCACHRDDDCASGLKGNDWQTIAAFASLSDGIEYAKECSGSESKFDHYETITVRLTSAEPANVWEYSPEGVRQL